MVLETAQLGTKRACQSIAAHKKACPPGLGACKQKRSGDGSLTLTIADRQMSAHHT